MNKKGISIIELIAFLVIITCIIIIILPKQIENNNQTKKSKYLEEVRIIVDNAKIMYQDNKYNNDTSIFSKIDDITKIIKLDKIKNIDDYVDVFGYLYDKNETYVKFIKIDNKTDIVVNVKSCDPNIKDGVINCYEIVDEDVNSLTENSIKNTIR